MRQCLLEPALPHALQVYPPRDDSGHLCSPTRGAGANIDSSHSVT